MTPTQDNPTETSLLERILATVESIDENVEEILEELSQHFTEARYDGWRSETCADRTEFD